MARIRQIKPEFFDDPEIGALPPLARLLFVGLWTEADRDGRLIEDELRLKVRLLPYDKSSVRSLLNELARARMIVPYSVNGRKYLQVRNFARHQHPHVKEPPSILPPCPPELLTVQHRSSTGPAPGKPGAEHGEGEGEHRSSTPGSGVLVLDAGGTYKNGGAGAPRFPQPVENPEPEPDGRTPEARHRKRDKPKVRTIAAVIRREGIHTEATPDHDEGDIADEVKTACGEYGVPYDSGAVTNAIESERFKRRNGLKAQGSGLTAPPSIDDVADEDLPPEATGDARGS